MIHRASNLPPFGAHGLSCAPSSAPLPNVDRFPPRPRSASSSSSPSRHVISNRGQIRRLSLPFPRSVSRAHCPDSAFRFATHSKTSFAVTQRFQTVDVSAVRNTLWDFQPSSSLFRNWLKSTTPAQFPPLVCTPLRAETIERSPQTAANTTLKYHTLSVSSGNHFALLLSDSKFPGQRPGGGP